MNKKTPTPTVVLKPGATDLRRSEKTLGAYVEKHTKFNAQDGKVYGFANKNGDKVKFFQNDDDGSLLCKRVSNKPIAWPEFSKEPVVMTGKTAKEFLDNCHIPLGQITQKKEAPNVKI